MRQLEAGIPYGGLGCSWVAEIDGRLAGAYRAYRLTQHLAGAPLPVLGVAAVATAPTARRRGVGRAICRHALRLGRERGEVASLLYPFRPSFYRALGWGLAGELHTFRFSPTALPLYAEAVHVRAGAPEDRDLIAACYARVAARSHGLIARDRPIWSYHLDRIGVYPYLYDAGGVRGYLLARFERGPAPEAGTLAVLELIAEDDEAYRALLGWIAAQRDQVREVSYDARPDERFDLRLSDPRPPSYRPARNLWFPTARRIRGPMLRVLDVAGALEPRTRWGDGTIPALALALEIHDAELPENRGPWRVLLEEGRAYVEPANGARGTDVALTTDAATFSEIYAGTLPPSAALRLGLAEGEGAIAALDRLFALEEPFWLLDEF
jgi:predicted acetyltransferase